MPELVNVAALKKLDFNLEHHFGCVVDFSTLIDIDALKQAAWIRGTVFVPYPALERVRREHRRCWPNLEEGLNSGILIAFSGQDVCWVVGNHYYNKESPRFRKQYRPIDYDSDLLVPLIKARPSLENWMRKYHPQLLSKSPPKTKEEFETEWIVSHTVGLFLRGFIEYEDPKLTNSFRPLDPSVYTIWLNCMIHADCMASHLPLLTHTDLRPFYKKRAVDILRFSIPDLTPYVRELAWDDIKKEATKTMLSQIFRSAQTLDELRGNLSRFKDTYQTEYSELASFSSRRKVREHLMGVVDGVSTGAALFGFPIPVPTFLPFFVWKKLRPKVREKLFVAETKWNELERRFQKRWFGSDSR